MTPISASYICIATTNSSNSDSPEDLLSNLLMQLAQELLSVPADIKNL